jgi:hypothetical protein
MATSTNPFDLRNIEWPKFELPKFDLPKFEMPDFELPKWELPKFDLPKLEDVEIPTLDQVTAYARDAAYVGIGLAAMTVERVQALQDQVVEFVKDQVERVRDAA